MIITAALKWASQKLEKKNIGSASLDAEVLLSDVLRKEKEFLYTYPEKKLTFFQKIKFCILITKRLKNYPVAYLTHKKEFYGYNFYINKHVLAPRPLTERIIELALEKINELSPGADRRLTICDVGTGSGNIIISLAKELQKKHCLDDFILYGLDISTKALRVAKKNAKLHQVEKNISFLKSDLLEKVINKRIDLILTNLPYLTKVDVKKEPSIKREPKQALIGSYEKFFRQLEKLTPRPAIIFEDKNGVEIR